MPKKSVDHVLGVEITEHSIKWVQRSLRSNLVDLIHIEPLDAAEFDAPGYLSGVLKTIARRYRRALKTQMAAVSIPAHMGRTLTLLLDPAEEDLPGAVEWELEQQTVGRRSRYWFDFQEMPPPAGRYFVAAVEEGRASSIVTSLRKARLNPSAFQVETIPLCNLFFHAYPAAEGFAGLVDIDSRRTLSCLVRKGQFLDSEFFLSQGPSAARGGAPDPKSLEAGLREMSRAAGGGSGDPGKLYFSGDYFADARFRDAYLSEISIPAEVVEPFHRVGLADSLKRELSQLTPALVIAAGLTLAGNGAGRP